MQAHKFDGSGGPEDLETLNFVSSKIKECMESYKSKEETVIFIHDTFQIPFRFTIIVWDLLEIRNPNFFRSYHSHFENIRNVSSEAVTAVAQTTPSNANPEASTSYTEPGGNKRRSKWFKAQKAKEQQKQPDNAPNDASSEVPQKSAVSSKTKRRSEARKKAKEIQRQQQQAPAEQVHKLLSDGVGQPLSDMKELKKQSSWEQVRGSYEEAETLQDLNQKLQQEMQRMDIPGNEGSDNSNEDTLFD